METTVYCIATLVLVHIITIMTIFSVPKILKKEAIRSNDYQEDDNEYRHTMTSLVEIYDGTVEALYCKCTM
jgi:hypothetical protein